jgi:poly(A) polymerase
MSQHIAPTWLTWPETVKLAEVISPLRFVGGCVRDALLGRIALDVDAATPLLPEEVMQSLRAAGLKAIPTGLDHCTVTARIGERHFEITTLRRDVATDGRRATVAFTHDWREDASRRDFTMNALFCDAGGAVYDYFGGIEDALSGHVRFIGQAHARIREDGLRILRFFRFFAHYGREPVDAGGLAACGELAELIDRLSGERIQQEMLKLLTSEHAGEVVGLMQRHGVWSFVVKAVVKTETLSRLPAMLRKAARAPDAVLSLALLLRTASGNTKTLTQNIAERWKLSKTRQKRLEALCELSSPSPSTGEPIYSPSPSTGEGWGGGKKTGGGESTGIPPSLILSPAKGEGDFLWKRQIRAWGKELFIDRALIAMAEGAEEASMLLAIKLAREWRVPEFPVTGDDLIALGLKPGKELGEKLKVLEEMWEKSSYGLSKEELLASLA